MVMRTSTLLLAIIGVLAVGSTAGAQSVAPMAVDWSAKLEPVARSYPPGSSFTVAISAAIREGWHVYSTEEVKDGPRPLRLALAGGQPFTQAGKLRAPEPQREFDETFNQVAGYYDLPVTFRLPVKVLPEAGAGAATLTIEVNYQACDGKMCLPGRAVKVTVPVTIAR
ncbi:MAG TPA: protein-disulfide reductase DsbD N-terminal domain-containing protein [Vicinamibacterales bacterium]|jgi:DsbC/DsbD-like thiol-disulfide interchange protein